MAAAASATKKKALALTRKSALAAYMADEGLFKDPTDILPNDYLEPQFPIGSIVLDHVLGFNGGLHHHGRMVMFQGPEHTGKTTLAVECAAAFQRFYDEPAFFFDFERTISVPYLWKIGMNPALTTIVQPSSVREAVKVIMNLLEKDLCRCFIFDSINMIIPDIKLEDILSGKRLVDDTVVGEHARFMTDFLKLITPIAAKRDALLLFINQQTTKIATNKRDQLKAKFAGGVTNVDYDVKGGKAPKQFASYQIETTKGGAMEGAFDEKEAWLYEGRDYAAGVAKAPNILRNHVRVLKNKVTGGGYREFDIYLRAGEGIDDWISVRALAQHYGMIEYLGLKKGYRVGTAERVIATYATKDDAKKALVLDQDMAVLEPLREMVIAAIQADDVSFRFNPSIADRIAAGEDTDDLALAQLVGGDDDSLQDVADI